MNPIRTVLLVPGHRHRRELRVLLSAHDGIRIEGEADCADEALRLCVSAKPVLAFVDPVIASRDFFSGFLARLGLAHVVVTATTPSHAVEAFEFGVVDYLLWPVSQARLALALSRVPPLKIPETTARRVTLKTLDGPRVFSTSRIACIEADDHTTKVVLVEGMELRCRRPIAEWERMLSGDEFQRLDRSTLINTTHVAAFKRLTRDSGEIQFASAGICLKVGRSAMQRIRKLAIFNHSPLQAASRIPIGDK